MCLEVCDELTVMQGLDEHMPVVWCCVRYAPETLRISLARTYAIFTQAKILLRNFFAAQVCAGCCVALFLIASRQ